MQRLSAPTVECAVITLLGEGTKGYPESQPSSLRANAHPARCALYTSCVKWSTGAGGSNRTKRYTSLLLDISRHCVSCDGRRPPACETMQPFKRPCSVFGRGGGDGITKSQVSNIRMCPQDMRIFQMSKRCHKIGDGQRNMPDIQNPGWTLIRAFFKGFDFFVCRGKFGMS